MARLTQGGLSEQLEGVISPGAAEFINFVSRKKLVLFNTFPI